MHTCPSACIRYAAMRILYITYFHNNHDCVPGTAHHRERTAFFFLSNFGEPKLPRYCLPDAQRNAAQRIRAEGRGMRDIRLRPGPNPHLVSSPHRFSSRLVSSRLVSPPWSAPQWATQCPPNEQMGSCAYGHLYPRPHQMDGHPSTVTSERGCVSDRSSNFQNDRLHSTWPSIQARSVACNGFQARRLGSHFVRQRAPATLPSRQSNHSRQFQRPWATG